MINFKLFCLLESILEVDGNLIKILEYLVQKKGDSLAAKILPLVKKDIKTHVNYMGVNDPESIKFIPDSQVEKTKEKGGNLWDGKNIGKVGRTFRQILSSNNITFQETEIEKFVNNYKNAYEVIVLGKSLDTFKLVQGREIQYWYHEENYVSGGGTLNNSCMRYDECQDYFDIYIQNPEVCQLLILTNDDDKLLGRALVWKLKNGEYYLDRIYTRWDKDVDRFKEYFMTKFNSKRGYNLTGTYGSDIVQLKTCSQPYPYMDSFRYLDDENCILYTDEDGETILLVLNDTEGGYESTGIWSDYRDEYILRSEAIQMGWDWVLPEDVIWSKYEDQDILKDYAVDSVYGKISQRKSIETENGWIPKDDLVYLDEKPIPFKWTVDNQPEILPTNPFKVEKNGKMVVVSKDDLIFDFLINDDHYLLDEFDTNQYPLLYQISEEDLKGIGDLDWRQVGKNPVKMVGYLNQQPLIIQTYRQEYLIDSVINKQFKIVDDNTQPTYYIGDIHWYVVYLNTAFDFTQDKPNLEEYLDEDVEWVLKQVEELKLYYLHDGDMESIKADFIQPIKEYFKKLEEIPTGDIQEFLSNEGSIQYYSSRMEFVRAIVLKDIFNYCLGQGEIERIYKEYKLPPVRFNNIPSLSSRVRFTHLLCNILYRRFEINDPLIQDLLEVIDTKLKELQEKLS